MILTVCLNPTFQRTLVFDHFKVGEVNRATANYLDASGKGVNVCRILSQLGDKAVLISHLGGSRIDEMLSLCRKDGLQVAYECSQSEIRTCTTIISPEGTTELVEEAKEVAKGTEEGIRKLFNAHIGACEALIICGTRAPGYSTNLYADFVREAKEQGKFVLLDLKGDDLRLCIEQKPDVIKPNLSEFVQTFLHKKIDEQEDSEPLQKEIMQALSRLYRLYETSTILSRGKDPLWYFDMSFKSCGIQKVKAVNTIGCGDALGAAFVHYLLQGKTFEEALREAVSIATRNAMTIHPGSIMPEDK